MLSIIVRLMKKYMKFLAIFFAVIMTIALVKTLCVVAFCSKLGSFESEKKDILQRRNYLVEKIITEPSKLMDEMPSAIAPQFQGEWAIYSCSMLSSAIANISILYPDESADAERQIDSLIKIVMSPELREYDAMRWYEDPLESLDGANSHMSYLSHLAWMISNYKIVAKSDGKSKYDELYSSLCQTMNRRMHMSPSLNLQTYPGECIYMPDMLVAIAVPSRYSETYNHNYFTTLCAWLSKAESEWLDPQTGLLVSFLPIDGVRNDSMPVLGSYSALNCYYLNYVDSEFAEGQYEKLKKAYLKEGGITGFKEFAGEKTREGIYIDSGPILLGLSPTGTAFAIGSATYYEDWELRSKLLKTAEMAGSSVVCGDKRHYLLANIALVGEAIALAMRTSVCNY